MSKGKLGTVVGRSEKRISSMRDRVLNEESAEESIETASASPSPNEIPVEVPIKEPKKVRKKRNHKIHINHFKALDDILAESFYKQKAAHDIVEAFAQMMDARGVSGVFEADRFERAAQNMCTVAMMKQMAWVFGLGPEHADRIAEHTIDRLFAPPSKTVKGDGK